MNADRFYLKFIFLFIFLLYVYSVAVHEFIEANTENATQAITTSYSTIRSNRSIVVKIDNKDYCRAPRISITVSARPEKFLRLLWDIEFVRDGDWISLFDADPQQGNEVVPIFSVDVKNTSGIIETNFTHVPTNSSELRFQSLCSEYWAVYFTKSGSGTSIQIIFTFDWNIYPLTCSRLLFENISDMDVRYAQIFERCRIKRMFLPGTHDSGSFSSINRWSPLNFIEKFVYTQDENILSQLIHGIRYLDLRISSYPSLDDRWWINHGVARVQPLRIILEDVKQFLRQTREIVILDFHGFPTGFSDDDSKSHQDFADYLKSQLAEWAAPPNWNSTCDDLWSINKTLILSYNHGDTVNANPSFLWPPVTHKWANAQDLIALKTYFTEIFASHHAHSWAAMAELTPTLWGILTYQANSLREMAEEVNPQVSSWFRGQWGKSCNIVAVDFFQGTDIVETAIAWNLRKVRKTATHTRICDIL